MKKAACFLQLIEWLLNSFGYIVGNQRIYILPEVYNSNSSVFDIHDTTIEVMIWKWSKVSKKHRWVIKDG